ncbi:MAG: GyrI-like domain-containing protein [Hyphomonadaceae bacterium]
MVQVALETVTPQLLAAVTDRVQIKDIPKAWEPAIYQVKAFLADRPDLGSGRQVFLYHHPTQRDQPMEIDFGIEVTKTFDPAGAVNCVATPEGRVAVATHLGALNSLPHTHMAIHHWCVDNGHSIGGFSWETYEWGSGPDPIRTIVRYILR